MDILMIVPRLPYPPRDGDSLRHYNLIKRLSPECNISLVCFSGVEGKDAGAEEMRRYCRDVEVVSLVDRSFGQWLVRCAASLVRGAPLFAAVHYVPEMKARVEALVRDRRFDIVQVEHTFMAEYLLDAAKHSRARTILTVHNIEAIRAQRMSRFEPWGELKVRYLIDALVLRRFEPWALRLPDRCITVSEANAQIIRRTIRDDVVVVENGVDVTTNLPLPVNRESHEMLFLGGMDYAPNIDGALYMAGAILPLIKQSVPGARLNLVGRNPDSRVKALAGRDGVAVCADVPEVKPWYERSAVTVVPLRSGGGTRLKILESMALGVPVVSTSVGCEGLEVTNGEDILIADTPEEFAASVCRLLGDLELRRTIAGKARGLVEWRYSWDAIAPRLLEVYRSLVGG